MEGYSGFQADMWSCGVTLFQLATGQFPFHGTSFYQLFAAIGKGVYAVPDHVQGSLRSLILGLLEVDPAKRLTVAQVLEHDWLVNSVPLAPGEQLVPVPPLLDADNRLLHVSIEEVVGLLAAEQQRRAMMYPSRYGSSISMSTGRTVVAAAGTTLAAVAQLTPSEKTKKSMAGIRPDDLEAEKEVRTGRRAGFKRYMRRASHASADAAAVAVQSMEGDDVPSGCFGGLRMRARSRRQRRRERRQSGADEEEMREVVQAEPTAVRA